MVSTARKTGGKLCVVGILSLALTASARGDFIIQDLATPPKVLEASDSYTSGFTTYTAQVHGHIAFNVLALPEDVTLKDLFNNAFAAQGSAWIVTGDFALSGTMALGTFTTFAGLPPSITQGSLNLAAGSGQNRAGLAMGLGYTKSAGEPNGLHWLQLVRATHPGQYAATNAPAVGWVPPGVTLPPDDFYAMYYLDNNGMQSPFYDGNYLANSSNFIDRPTRLYSNDKWDATLVMAKDLGNNQIEISSSFSASYGFIDPVTPSPTQVPAPKGLLLFIFAIPLLFANRVWKSARHT